MGRNRNQNNQRTAPDGGPLCGGRCGGGQYCAGFCRNNRNNRNRSHSRERGPWPVVAPNGGPLCGGRCGGGNYCAGWCKKNAEDKMFDMDILEMELSFINHL